MPLNVRPDTLGTLVEQIYSRLRALESPGRLTVVRNSFADVLFTVTSNTWTTPPTAPSLTVRLGQTSPSSLIAGTTVRCRVTVSCYIGTPPGVEGIVGLFIDGIFFDSVLALGGTGVGLAANVCTDRVLTHDAYGAPFGQFSEHTFSLKYKSGTSGQVVNFGANSLVVEPLT